MPRVLSDLHVHEVSLVDRGANRKRFMILKTDGGGDVPTTMDDLDLEPLNDAPDDEEAYVAGLGDVSPKARDAARAALRLLAAHKDELPRHHSALLGAGAKSKPSAGSDEPSEGFPLSGTTDPTGAEQFAQDELESAVRRAQTNKAAGSGLADGALQRNLRDVAWQAIEKAADEQQRLRPDLTRERAVELALRHDPSAQAAYATYAEAAPDETVADYVSKRMAPAGNAYAEIERAADALVQKEQGLTREQAIAKALEQSPDLYEAYLREQRA